MTAQEEKLNDIQENIRNEERGWLRLGISIQRGMQLLPLVLSEFSRRCPDARPLKGRLHGGLGRGGCLIQTFKKR